MNARDARVDDSLEATFKLWVRDCYPFNHPDTPSASTPSSTTEGRSGGSSREIIRATSSTSLPRTMAEAVTTYLPHCDVSSWSARLAWGGLYLNGKPVTDLSMTLPATAPFRLEYFEPKVT
jgi:hypothetical protein